MSECIYMCGFTGVFVCMFDLLCLQDGVTHRII